MCLTSEILMPITPLFMNENKVWIFNVRNNVVPKLLVFSKVFVFFLHFHRLPCELENALVLYKIKRKFAFFFVNTKYISSRELKT